ncbi:Flp pilus assembly protein TadB [Yersinia pekkanenii]|uniref:Flp pilus assembly protein TadB n=1 Tax=Yersinia pekkanenii TaxID=1288385 RepID=A0A0T9P5K6_9GAMM|nr:Flp pilus assembly protein TadB [Yersinia pekkanenii]CRY67621.1 Flp pilus assembly protein TadB [Yersinia pekkanenii]
MMIYYIIASSGILLFLLVNIKWVRIKKSISKPRKKHANNDYFIHLFPKKVFNEWMLYLVNINKSKNKKHILIPIGYASLIFFAN